MNSRLSFASQALCPLSHRRPAYWLHVVLSIYLVHYSAYCTHYTSNKKSFNHSATNCYNSKIICYWVIFDHRSLFLSSHRYIKSAATQINSVFNMQSIKYYASAADSINALDSQLIENNLNLKWDLIFYFSTLLHMYYSKYNVIMHYFPNKSAKTNLYKILYKLLFVNILKNY